MLPSPNDHAKQAAHGWGADTAGAELDDEKAGAAIAKEEEKGGFDTVVDAPVNADGETLATEPAPVEREAEAEPEAEPEDKTKSYVEYLADLAAKKLSLGSLLNLRSANEGSTKKAPEGKELTKEEQAEYFAGSGGKAKRERERKDKNVLVLDHDIQARERESAPRGARGGSSRGGARGRGEGGFRGEGRGRGGRGRGEGRGGEGRGGGGEGRGARGGAPRSSGAPNLQVDDTSFPSLGK